MRPVENILERLKQFVKDNEVVYQACKELIEVPNEEYKDNRLTLLCYFYDASSEEVFQKGH